MRDIYTITTDSTFYYYYLFIMMMFKLIVSFGKGIVISLKVLLDHYISKSMPFFLKQRTCTYLVRSLLYKVSLLTDKKCVVITENFLCCTDWKFPMLCYAFYYSSVVQCIAKGKTA